MNIEHEGEARCMECDASIMCLFVMFFVVFVVDHHVLLVVVVEVIFQQLGRCEWLLIKLFSARIRRCLKCQQQHDKNPPHHHHHQDSKKARTGNCGCNKCGHFFYLSWRELPRKL